MQSELFHTNTNWILFLVKFAAAIQLQTLAMLNRESSSEFQKPRKLIQNFETTALRFARWLEMKLAFKFRYYGIMYNVSMHKCWLPERYLL